MRMVCLLGGCDVIFEVGGSMLPCLQTLAKELRDLDAVSTVVSEGQLS